MFSFTFKHGLKAALILSGLLVSVPSHADTPLERLWQQFVEQRDGFLGVVTPEEKFFMAPGLAQGSVLVNTGTCKGDLGGQPIFDAQHLPLTASVTGNVISLVRSATGLDGNLNACVIKITVDDDTGLISSATEEGCSAWHGAGCNFVESLQGQKLKHLHFSDLRP